MTVQESVKYKCKRCKSEITDDEDVLILKVMLSAKNEVIDLCKKCTKDFYTFINEVTIERQRWGA